MRRPMCFKESIWDENVRTEARKQYAELLLIKHKRTKAFAKKTKEERIVELKKKQKAISELREELRNYQQTFYAFKQQMGKVTVIINWQETPITRDQIISERNKLFKKVRDERRRRRDMDYRDCSFLGYKYEKIGGVFTSVGSIKKLEGTVTADQKLEAKKAPHTFQPESFVGIEIECNITCSKEYLADKLIDAGLQSYCQIKDDGSIRCERSNDKPVELILLAKEFQVNDIIKRVCDVLHSRRIDARANNSCGLHVHLDMRRRNIKECYKNLYYAQGVMLGMMPENRRVNVQYCKQNATPDYDKQDALRNRYHVINTEAFKKYKTLEIRVHSGTTNATKIMHWVSLLTSIVNYKGEELSYPIKSIDKFISTFGINEKLADYISKRTKVFADVKLNEQQYEEAV